MPTRKEVNCLTGEVVEHELTQAELDAIAAQPALPGPTPLEQIRAIEAAKADDSTKVVRQTLLMAVVDKAMERPEVVAMLQVYRAEEVKAQVIATLVATDPGFRLLWELEQAIEPLRVQVQ
jgi:hypothetical protein